jgi:hypothetical protein
MKKANENLNNYLAKCEFEKKITEEKLDRLIKNDKLYELTQVKEEKPEIKLNEDNVAGKTGLRANTGKSTRLGKQ